MCDYWGMLVCDQMACSNFTSDYETPKSSNENNQILLCNVLMLSLYIQQVWCSVLTFQVALGILERVYIITQMSERSKTGSFFSLGLKIDRNLLV